MLKKLLILPLLGGIMGLGAFASADCITENHSSDFSISTANSSTFISDNGLPYSCDDTVNMIYKEYEDGIELGSQNVSLNCNGSLNYYGGSSLKNSLSHGASFEFLFQVVGGDITIYSANYNSEDCPISGGDDDDNSSVFPTIPSSFTSGLTAVVNNFGSIIVGRLPTIILISLGIYAIFVLFRVVRNYARSSFNG